MDNYFDWQSKELTMRNAPLADRLRPQNLDEFVGQSHILAEGRLLRRAIQADQLSSLIFFGPPGTGKTTLAQIIANTTRAKFLSINAVLAGIKDIRENIELADRLKSEHCQRTILFIDEVHRFNKAQQDALLPHVENGTIILIGATTENPYFEVNKALVSRSRIFELKPLGLKELKDILDFALKDERRGYGGITVRITGEAKEHFAKTSNGDARTLLNALELAVMTSQPSKGGDLEIDLDIAEESIQQRAVFYDKDGDAHFDTISAFIKSLRGSDVDAALYWMAKMLYGGEDPRFIFRRMLIFASEDIGMADPQALSMVVNAARAYDYVGMPEGRFHLSQACIYLATAEKSNSGFAFFDALRTVQSETKDEVPNHLKDASRDKKGLGHGKDYQYPHAFKDHWAAQQYLPESLQGKYFYNPSSQGYESKIKQRVERLRQELLAGSLESGEFFELTANEFWKQRSLGDFREQENQIMEYLFGQLKFNREELVLNLNAGSGLFFGELVRLLPLATLYGGVYQPKEKELLEKTLGLSNLKGDFNLFHIDTSVELNSFSAIPPQTAFDHIIGKNALKPLSDKSEYIALLKKYLSREGILALAETIPKQGQRLSRYVQLFEIKMDQGLLNDWIKLEELMFEKENNPLLSWDDQSLEKDLQQAGFDILLKEKTSLSSQLFMPKSKISRWFGTKEKPSYYGNFLSETLRPKQTETIRELLLNSIGDRVLPWTQTWLFIKAQIQKSEQFSETKPLNES